MHLRKQQREWLLFGVMAALVVATVAVAWLDVPELSPAAVTYSATVAAETVTATTAADAVTERLSLNTATAEELMRLDGLGEKTAEKILAYRESHGGFDRVEELLEISGIGEKKVAAWEPYLTV